MCQLLGMSSDQPTDICFSFTEFKARGGATDHHADGWGIAFYEGQDVRVLRDPQASCASPLAELISRHPILSTNVVAHIRKATCGGVGLQNTHPFHRELWGKHWVFAHNGCLRGFTPALSGRFQPVGETDSELAFCWLLQRLSDAFGESEPAGERLLSCLQALAIELAPHGTFNFLLSNGRGLYAHSSSRLSHLCRQVPLAERPVGEAAQRSIIVATTPLTEDESWVSMPAGSLWCFRDGLPESMLATRPGTPLD